MSQDLQGFRPLNEIVESIKESKDFGVSSWDQRENIPFEITPIQFLDFAQRAIEEETQAGYVNALSNVKRAIECQLDLLLCALGQHEKAQKKRWSFPRKIEFIKSVGLVAPEILRKVNKARIHLEHEYKYPRPEEVKDAFDIADLFLAYSSKFVEKKCAEFEIELREGESGVWIKFDEDKNLFEIAVPEPRSRKVVKYIVGEKDENYLSLLKTYVEFMMQL